MIWGKKQEEKRQEKTLDIVEISRVFIWSERQDLNLRPLDPQSSDECEVFSSSRLGEVQWNCQCNFPSCAKRLRKMCRYDVCISQQ